MLQTKWIVTTRLYLHIISQMGMAKYYVKLPMLRRKLTHPTRCYEASLDCARQNAVVN